MGQQALPNVPSLRRDWSRRKAVDQLEKKKSKENKDRMMLKERVGNRKSTSGFNMVVRTGPSLERKRKEGGRRSESQRRFKEKPSGGGVMNTQCK